MPEKVQLRRARPDDADFAWELYAETIKPHISPKLKNGWKDGEQKRQFETWWRPENTMIFTMADDQKAGWISFHEKGDHVELEHAAVLPEFQQQGILSHVLQQLLDGWQGKAKSIELSLLKDSHHRKMIEDFGFRQTSEDQLTVRMRKHE